MFWNKKEDQVDKTKSSTETNPGKEKKETACTG